jgi:hypothetical protein
MSKIFLRHTLTKKIELFLPTVTTYETLTGRYVELLPPTVITYETLAGRYVELLLHAVITVFHK